MSSEAITRNDLKAVLNEVLPSEPVEADYVVEQGTSGVWTYRKWESGLVELFGYTHQNISKGWSSAGVVIPFPFQLTDVLSWYASAGNYQVDRCYLNRSNSQISIQTYSDADVTNAVFAFGVKGMWK